MAKQFRFRLETVRKIREQEQETQRREMAKAVGAVTQMQDQILRLNDQLRLVLSEARDVKKGRDFTTTMLRNHQLHRDWMHRKIRESELDLLDRRKKLSQEQAKFTEVRKRLKVIEKLREKQWLRYQREQMKESQMEQDEAAQQLYHRQRMASGAMFGSREKL